MNLFFFYSGLCMLTFSIVYAILVSVYVDSIPANYVLLSIIPFVIAFGFGLALIRIGLEEPSKSKRVDRFDQGTTNQPIKDS